MHNTASRDAVRCCQGLLLLSVHATTAMSLNAVHAQLWDFDPMLSTEQPVGNVVLERTPAWLQATIPLVAPLHTDTAPLYAARQHTSLKQLCISD